MDDTSTINIQLREAHKDTNKLLKNNPNIFFTKADEINTIIIANGIITKKTWMQ